MKFPSCGEKPIGLYPVVDRAEKLESLYQVGITTAQLRVKGLTGNQLIKEIMAAIEISRQFETRLFINDHWELAIKYNAYGIHLGQEDIKEANMNTIRESGLRLGISIHTVQELKSALDLEPSYVAIGPMYKTNSKEVAYEPVGISNLQEWAKDITCPVVAIGGISVRNIKTIIDTGVVSGVAMIKGVLDGNDISKKKTINLMGMMSAK